MQPHRQALRLLVALLALPASQAATAQQHTLTGKLDSHDYDGLTIYLSRPSVGDRQSSQQLDSARIDNATFAFRFDAPAEPFVARLALPPKDDHFVYGLPEATVILEPADIAVTYQGYSTTLSGGPLTSAYDEVLGAERHAREQAMALNQQFQANANHSSEEQDEQNQRISNIFKAARPAMHRFVADNIGNNVGAYFFYAYSSDYYPDSLRTVLEQRVSPAIRQRHEAMERALADEQKAQQRALETTREQMPYHDFASLTPDGQTVRLSQLVAAGRIVLLDFWASWCGPCRQFIPDMKRLYEQWHQQGLDIVSVSLDTKREAWQRAISQEQMPWTQLSTLEGFSAEAARAYAVHAIPYVCLINGTTGRIELVNLHGEVLENKIKELLE